ncbi:Auxin responsive protein [Musa troglodytarum]|uniref:Auxin responsive protein n=1 Tax=Musa troglodytarum TaxID=320322 RepID=A0A9E7H6K0_9LILI|nr:Auxin responsive protein [Musa troglodytarum]
MLRRVRRTGDAEIRDPDRVFESHGLRSPAQRSRRGVWLRAGRCAENPLRGLCLPKRTEDGREEQRRHLLLLIAAGEVADKHVEKVHSCRRGMTLLPP